MTEPGGFAWPAGRARLRGKESRYRTNRLNACLGFALALVIGNAVRGATAYDEIVVPILRARCVECHGEQKQKAKLAVHTWDSLQKGSDAGPILVAGKPDES